jgi:hypothetical protein
MGLLIVVMFVAALIGTMLAVVWWIYRPVLAADSRHSGPDHYTLIDAACLTFYLGLFVTIAKGTLPTDTGLQGEGIGLAIVAAVVMWWGSVRVLSRTAVGHPGKRAAFMVFAVPFSLVCAVTIALAPIAGSVAYFNQLQSAEPMPIWLAMLLTLIAFSVACGLSFAIHRLLCWVILRDTYSDRFVGPIPIRFEKNNRQQPSKKPRTGD